MISEHISISDTITYLNSLVEADPEAVLQLIEQRVPCNIQLANHPRCQVVAGNPSQVGLLGILNGLFGADEDQWGTIASVSDVVCTGTCQGVVDTPEDGQGANLPCRVCGGPLKYRLLRFVDLGRR